MKKVYSCEPEIVCSGQRSGAVVLAEDIDEARRVLSGEMVFDGSQGDVRIIELDLLETSETESKVLSTYEPELWY